MARFFFKSPDISGDVIHIRDVAHVRALRLRVGDELTLCDGAGTDFRCRLAALGADFALAEIAAQSPSRGEPSVRLSVFLAYAKGERLEYAVQKCVELGAAEFFLFPSERTVSTPDGRALAKKLARLAAISESAAEQSGRGIIPDVSACDSFESAVITAKSSDLPLFFYENEKNLTLRDAFSENSAPKSVAIVTGAEGGFTPGEAAIAAQHGLRSVSLGARILRCDTAPIAASAAVMYITGNI
jgi:16S rRNA (uracil1498-N3)-methyltransferase